VQQRLDLTFEGFSNFMFHQPLSRGGIGFTPSASCALPGFVASVAATLPYIRHTPLKTKPILRYPTLQAIHASLQTLENENISHQALPQELPAFIKKFRSNPPPNNLQNTIHSLRQAESRGKQLSQYSADKVLMWLWESRQTPLASAALKAYPLTSEFKLTDEETRFMVAHATANKPKEVARLCSCGDALDLNHATSCGPNMLIRHNRVEDRFVAMAREQGCTTEQNPRVTTLDAAKMLEPDIVFYFGFGHTVETDITVVNPTAPCYIGRSKHPVQGSALHSAEQRKINKYQERANHKGRHFLPLGFETHGNSGEGVLKLLQRLAALTKPGIGLAVSDMIMDLQVTLVKGNALCARTVAARARRAEDKRRDAAQPPR